MLSYALKWIEVCRSVRFSLVNFEHLPFLIFHSLKKINFPMIQKRQKNNFCWKIEFLGCLDATTLVFVHWNDLHHNDKGTTMEFEKWNENKKVVEEKRLRTNINVFATKYSEYTLTHWPKCMWTNLNFINI